MAESDDYKRGKEIVDKLMGPQPEPSAVRKDAVDITTEHLFGRIWSRPGLKIRDRSLITVAAITALGRERQLRNHLRGALNAGITRDEIKEIMLHLAHYAGWPAGMTGLLIAEEIFKEADAKAAGAPKA